MSKFYKIFLFLILFLPFQTHAENVSFKDDVITFFTTIKTEKLDGVELYKRVSPSVYTIVASNLKDSKPDLSDSSLGSAIAVGPKTLLTNCHLLYDKEVFSLIKNKVSKAAKMAYYDLDRDMCVLESTEELPSYVHIRPYNDIEIGEDVYTIGSPWGYELTIANGIVSGKREMRSVRFIQTNASMSLGSSGGGLFDSYGNLIGITTLYKEDAQNLNFALAAEDFIKK